MDNKYVYIVMKQVDDEEIVKAFMEYDDAVEYIESQDKIEEYEDALWIQNANGHVCDCWWWIKKVEVC